MDARQDEISLVREGERRPGPPTPGMDRQEAFSTDRLWAGLVRTEPDMVSGWHHHGDHETAVYVVSGSLRMEFGPDGSNIVDAGPGDFLRVPRGLVHRESNPLTEPSEVVVIRAGTGPSSFNVGAPDESSA